MDLLLWIVIGALVVLVLGGIYLYNRLVTLRTRAENGWSQIDVQLRRRYDLIPNLVETVQGYAAHERELFESVTEARAHAAGASGAGDRARAENEVTTGLRQLMAVVEAYPDLKADRHFLELQEELAGTEGKIAYARQFYNDTVAKLNTAAETFPGSLVARSFGFTQREFFDIEDPIRAPIAVDMGAHGADGVDAPDAPDAPDA